MAQRTKWPTADLSRIGRGALALAEEERGTLAERLPAGLLDGLTADLDAFEGKRAAAVLAAESLREATRAQDAAVRAAHDFLVAARGAIARNRAVGAERAAFGLSLPLKPQKVSSVIAALDALIDGATRLPDVARNCGLIGADLDNARALRSALSTADAEQETRKQTRKTPTAERVAMQFRIEQAVDAIVAAGVLAFVAQPAKAGRFRELLPSKKRRGKKSDAPPAP